MSINASCTHILTADWRVAAGQTGGTQILAALPRELATVPLPSSWGVVTMAAAAENYDGKRVPVRASDRAARQGSYPYFGASGVIDTIDAYLFDGNFLLIGVAQTSCPVQLQLHFWQWVASG
jgi:hypothetical protein